MLRTVDCGETGFADTTGDPASLPLATPPQICQYSYIQYELLNWAHIIFNWSLSNILKEKKTKVICRVRTGEALHTFKLHFCHVTEKWIFTDNFLLSVLVYFLQNQEGNTSASHETWARLFFLNFLDCNFIQN